MGNEETTETAPAESVEVDDEMDFTVDLTATEGEPEAEEASAETAETTEEVDKGQETGEYKLDLSELDAEDMPYVDILTAQAQAAGLDAKSASTFIVGFTKELHDYHAKLAAEEGQALKKEWGKDFAAKKKQTAQFMGNLFASAGLTEEESALFHNPAMYRVMRKVMGVMGERGGRAVASTPQKSMSKQERINMHVSELVKLNENPNENFAQIQSIKKQINAIAGITLY